MSTSARGPLPNTGILIDGRWEDGECTFPLFDKYTGRVMAEVARASREQVTRAVRNSNAASDAGPPPPHERAATLRRAAELLLGSKQQFINIMVAEAGFPLCDILAEFDRAQVTLQLSADEAPRLTGDTIPFAASPGAHNRIGFTLRFPVGVVAAITPFNAPLNTVLHKLAPAYAAGNAVILKPSVLTPLTSALLAELLLEAGMPPAFLSVLQGDGETVGNWLLEEPEVAFYTFTGSTRVGRLIQAAAGLRRTQMELGSIASTILCEDSDLDLALPKVVRSSFQKAGQVCTSIQRLYVHDAIADEVEERLVELVSHMRSGDPGDPRTQVGPMISEEAAKRTEDWTREAVKGGAKLRVGGERSGTLVTPAVLAQVPETTRVWRREAFAPLVVVRRFADYDWALASANDTPYGLAAGVFTQDYRRVLKAMRTLRFGTVHFNETSSARADVMPFGGVKDSGFGREGPAFAAREMTEERLMVLNP